MDLDLSLISSCLYTDDGFMVAKRMGIVNSMLSGEGEKGWSFIVNHHLQYGVLPSVDFFVAKTGIQILEPTEKIEVVLNEIKKKALWSRAIDAHKEMEICLNDGAPDLVFAIIRKFLDDVAKGELSTQKIGSLLSMAPDVWDQYIRMKNGERGIPTPWPAMDEMTLGWWPGDFIVIVARMSTGKTWTLLMAALAAWMGGKRVLFVGTEMSRLALATRFFSLHFKLPYGDFRRGHLATETEGELKNALDLISNEKGIYVVGDDFDAEIGQIISAVDQMRPDMLIVDGLYLVKNEGKDRHTRVSNTADDLKRLAKRMKIPVLCSTQFNREVTGNGKSTVSAVNVGISDVIGWNADVMFGMFQGDDMKEEGIMGFAPLKIREGVGSDFFTRWKMDEMDFHQLSVDEGSSGYKDNDYDGIPVSSSMNDDGALF